MPNSIRFICLAAMFAAMLLSSCTLPGYSFKNMVPHRLPVISALGVSQMVIVQLPYRNMGTMISLPDGSIVVARVGQHDNIHLIRLNDSLEEVAEYSSPAARAEQRPLAIIPRNGVLHAISAEYQRRDSMALILRTIEPGSMKEQQMNVLARMPRQILPHNRSTYAVAISPDSSKAVAYTTDVHPAGETQPMIDLVLIDLKTQKGDTARFPAQVSENIIRELRGEYYLRYVVPEVHLTNDGRAYVVYHRQADSIRFTCYDIPGKTFVHSSVRLPAAPCPEELIFFCNPKFTLDHQGNLYTVVRNSSKDIIDGITVAKFDGKSPEPLFIRNIPISPSLLEAVKSVPGARSLTVAAMIPNATTGGATILLQPRDQETRSVQEFVGLQENIFSQTIFYLFGDIIAVAFDAEGKQVWENHLASNLLAAPYNPYPHVLAHSTGDVMEVAYASDASTAAINIYSIKVSQHTGDASPRRQILQYQGELYFDFQRTVSMGADRFVWYADTENEDAPGLVRTW